MKSGRSWGVVVLALLGSSLLIGCAETRLAAHVAKKASQESQPSANERRIKADRVRKATLRPYTIRGVRYVPKDDPNYDETGIASWYGQQFHGRPTATGEIFDMNRVSAAHKTLPLPTTVEVINLENGRALTVRVNDRGPFVHGRIIDLSRRAAQLLGFQKQGIARVRVRLAPSPDDQFVIRPKKLTDAEKRSVKPAPRKKVKVAALPPPNGQAGSASVNRSTPRVQPATPAVRPTALFVQSGSFLSYENALRQKSRMSRLGETKIAHTLINGQDWFRVRVGPVSDVAAADRLLSSVMAEGADDARIVVE